jgi:hypothetical protein
MRRSRQLPAGTRLGAGAIALLLALGACSASRSDASRPVRSTSPRAAPGTVGAGSAISWWTSTEGGGVAQQRYTAKQAAAIARRFDRILGLKTTFEADGLTPIMRAANPDLELIVYLNGTHMSFNDALGRPESWFAHDASGRRVRNLHFDNWVMNLRNPLWPMYTAARCLDFAARMGTSSCYLDDMGAGNLTSNFSAPPVDPRTGTPYTEYSWLTATTALAASVRALVPGITLYANGLNAGKKYFAGPRSARLLDALEGAEAESFVRASGDGVDAHRSVTDWKSDVDMLVDAESRGRQVLAKTKLWVPATAAQRDRWREFAFGTFLLGTSGRSSFAFNGHGPGKPDGRSPLESIDLGVPTARYVEAGGVYRRPWTRGTVWVNPGSTARRVALGGRFRISGEVVDHVDLAPHDALILKQSQAVAS